MWVGLMGSGIKKATNSSDFKECMKNSGHEFLLLCFSKFIFLLPSESYPFLLFGFP